MRNYEQQAKVRELMRQLAQELDKQPYCRDYPGYLIIVDTDFRNVKLVGCKNVDGCSPQQRADFPHG